MHPVIPTAIVPSVAPAQLSPRQVAQEFEQLLADGQLHVAGEAKDEPASLLARGYTPQYQIALFDTLYYLSKVRQNPDIRFFVAYVVPAGHGKTRAQIYARIFYKDVSLIWRSASHVVRSASENWIGKGDVTIVTADGFDTITSAEETTDLPLEIQTALEVLCRRQSTVRTDNSAVGLVLRNGPDHRIRPYRDFSEPRRQALTNPRNRINGGKRIAWFAHSGDPESLIFAPGFAPDFEAGILETTASESTLYGGMLQRFRILSQNRQIQYLFFAGPHHTWIIPPQATTTEIMSFGVRTVGVAIDDDLCVPGYEYHYMDHTEEPPVLVSQIPVGFVGAPSAVDPARADASAWLDRLPVVREFRRKLRLPT